VFGLSLSELVVIGVVALIAVGPQKLPGMLRTLGEWLRKLRILTHEMRAQSGIDDILRSEGIHGGLSELRGLMRGHQFPPALYTPPAAAPAPVQTPTSAYDPYAGVEIDATKEYPPEGADAYDTVPDDLFDDGVPQEAVDEELTAELVPVEPEPLLEPPPPLESVAKPAPLAGGDAAAPSAVAPAPAPAEPGAKPRPAPLAPPRPRRASGS